MVQMESDLYECNACHDRKPISTGFYKNKAYTCGHDYKCKECRNKAHHIWYKKHKAKNPERYAQFLQQQRAAHVRNVQKVLDHYGRECSCCGENEPKFLTVDHIVEIGSKQRYKLKHHTIYLWLVRHKFPEGFRILCSNCNHGRARNGGVCPHQEGSQARAQARSRKCGEVPEALVQGQDMVESASKVAAVVAGNWMDNPYWPFDVQ